MTKAQKNMLLYVLFIITYSLSCFTVSTDKIEGYNGYFSSKTTQFMIFKFLLIFSLTLLSVVINKSNTKRITNYTCVFLNITLLIYIFDYYVTELSGNSIYCKIWWLCAIFVTQAGFYIGLSIAKPKDFKTLARKFWLSFIPVFTFTFLIVFLRQPNSYYELNLKIGDGLFSYLGYTLKYFSHSTWSVFGFVGNFVFFIPIPFMLKASFQNMKKPYVFLVGFTVPLLVEGYQFVFKCGSVDIDDIILNELGIIVGMILLLAEQKRTAQIK